MKTVILYGELANRFGKTHKFAAKNVADVIRALRANFKGFEEFLCNADKYGMGFKVYVGGSSLGNVEQIHDPVSEKNIIRIAPAILGSGGSLGKILLGAVLIAAGVFLFQPGAIATGLVSLGAAFVIGGIASFLTRPPHLDEASQPDKKTSYIFSGPVNSTIQGGSVPVGYGRLIIGSVIISAGIETYEAQ